jgi:hypothetical protein
LSDQKHIHSLEHKSLFFRSPIRPSKSAKST